MPADAPHPPPTAPAAPGPVILVVGTTASGKSELAMAIAEALPRGGECLSADSMQIYRGLDLGTAKPTAADRQRVPHHLLDLADPHELERDFTVADWIAAAREAIAEIDRLGRVPIVVGGTHLYLQALLQGLFEGPAIDPGLRRSLEEMPLATLREELVRCDPEAAARIHPADRRRAVRAVEVHRQTGVPLSAWQTQWASQGTEVAARAIVISIERPTAIANGRINRRVRAMLEAGWLEEVEGLLARGPLHRQAAEAVGYRELGEVLAGRRNLADAAEAIKIRTRRYAKQQRTWLKRFMARPGTIRLEAGERPVTGGDDPLLEEVRDRLAAASGASAGSP